MIQPTDSFGTAVGQFHLSRCPQTSAADQHPFNVHSDRPATTSYFCLPQTFYFHHNPPITSPPSLNQHSSTSTNPHVNITWYRHIPMSTSHHANLMTIIMVGCYRCPTAESPVPVEVTFLTFVNVPPNCFVVDKLFDPTISG